MNDFAPDFAPDLAAGLASAARLAEALIFASAEPVSPAVIARALPDEADPDAVMAALQAQYAGHGVELVEIGGGWQFRTAADLAPLLTRTIQQKRRLPRAAMETLSVIAYHQPVTRSEIETIRGATLGQGVVESLLEAGLIEPRGRKEVPGRPTLWATTAAFLAQFGLRDLRDLPRREDLLNDAPIPLGQSRPMAEPDPGPERAATVAPESFADDSERQ